MAIINERVHFKLIAMECCGHLFCSVNPRLPNYCPECGKRIYPACKSWITFEDAQADIRFKTAMRPPSIKT